MSKDNRMTWKDWMLCLLIFSIIIPAMIFFARNEEKRLFDVTIQNGKYNLYNQRGEALKGISKDSLDKVLIYEYQIGE